MSNPVRWLGHVAGTAVGRRYPFVLCYHGVGSPKQDLDPHGIFLSTALFRQHVETIERQKYQLLSVSELWKRMRDGQGASGTGAITFDDGLTQTAENAIPMLIERGIPCSLFVPTGLIGRPHPDLAGESIVTRSQILDLDAAGVEIGTHGVDHVALSGLSREQALGQVTRSRATMEDLLGKAVTTMAYPFGAVDEQAMRVTEEAGYEIACGCSGPGPWEAMSLPREPIFATATPLRLRLKMAGLYGPAYALVGDRGPLHRQRGARSGS